MWRKGNLCALLVGLYIDIAIIKSSTKFSKKKKKKLKIL